MKFLVPNYSCLQNPWLGATAPRSPFSLSFVLNWICWTPPPNKIPGYATASHQFSRRSVLLDAILLMCCTSPVIPSHYVSIFNPVNPRTYTVFMHLRQLRIQITLSIHVVLPFVFASRSPAHVFRVFIPSLLSFNAVTTNERGWATAECPERPLILR